LNATAKKRNTDQTRGHRIGIDIRFVLGLLTSGECAPFFVLSFVAIQAFESICVDVSDFVLCFGLRPGVGVGARVVGPS
jgi:hypothetical protein